jgi:hypothetical protein
MVSDRRINVDNKCPVGHRTSERIRLNAFLCAFIRYTRELLNNCIAHQDYTSGGRIYVDEYEDQVVLQNPFKIQGRFLREIFSQYCSRGSPRRIIATS